jgi:Leucine rich repeat
MAKRKQPKGLAEAERRIEETRAGLSIGLDLRDLGPRELPESLGRLSQLEMLDLDENRLTSVPECFAQLADLKTLELSWNRLASLPSSMVKLTKLKSFFLHGNEGIWNTARSTRTRAASGVSGQIHCR